MGKFKTLAVAIAAIVAASLPWLIVGNAHATVISLTTADGLGADTFLNGGPEILDSTGLPRRDSNFGALDRLVVKFAPQGSNNNDTNFDSRFTRLSLLRFDLSSVTGTVTAAKLTLGVKLTELDANVTFSLNLLSDGAGLDAAPGAGGWDETGITMANSLLAGILPLEGLGGRNTVLGGIDTMTMFSGNSLRQRIRDDTNDLITFAILPFLNSPQGIQFFSKENPEGVLIPTLELTVDEQNSASVSEPGALALLGLGLVGFALARRRKRAV